MAATRPPSPQLLAQPVTFSSPFHVLSDSALSTIAHAVGARILDYGHLNTPAERIELHNFLVDIESELQKRGASGTSYNIPSIETDNSDLLG